ncbi:exodeoxyribonuclease VII (large subunit) [Ruminococcaceae bacterium BL-6]|nr:exodeoxyribonuclease VII (large subunit) [Ruminococcaceae bacterium BL-6]
MNTPIVLTVTQLNRYLKSIFDGDAHLANVFLTGEISNFTDHYRSGHLYFSLKDDRSVIRAVMFAQQARRLKFRPGDGMRVIARGRVSVYEQSGQYQLYVQDMQPDGLGALNLAFEQLKKRLAAEGLFDPERKKSLPKFPQSVGVVTSPTGAAVQDIRQILGRRYPLAQVVLCPVLVQGEGAAEQIAEAIRRFNRLRCADVLIVGRGGGSIEDLWAFNEEIVARAVAESEIPVISAVGHETDYTICDFAADLRAPTPSAAAELAVPDVRELLSSVSSAGIRMKQALSLDLRRMQTDRLVERMVRQMKREVETGKMMLSQKSAALDTLSPLRVLERGYAVALDPKGAALKNAADAVPGEPLTLLLSRGKLACRVEKILNTERDGGHNEKREDV